MNSKRVKARVIISYARSMRFPRRDFGRSEGSSFLSTSYIVVKIGYSQYFAFSRTRVCNSRGSIRNCLTLYYVTHPNVTVVSQRETRDETAPREKRRSDHFRVVAAYHSGDFCGRDFSTVAPKIPISFSRARSRRSRVDLAS